MSSFFHGDLRRFKASDYNKKLKKSYGELYEKTLKKEKYIQDTGHNLVTMWDTDWKLMVKKVKFIQRFWVTHRSK